MLPTIRRLLPSELNLYRDHLLCLSQQDRALRFGASMSDAAITAYVDSLEPGSTVVKAVFDDDLNLVAAAHIALLGDTAAELGLSVDPKARGQGLGTQLFEASVQWLRLHGVKRVHAICRRENATMVAIARKEGMHLMFEGGEAEAHLDVPEATPMTAWQEATDEGTAWFYHGFLGWLRSWWRAA